MRRASEQDATSWNTVCWEVRRAEPRNRMRPLQEHRFVERYGAQSLGAGCDLFKDTVCREVRCAEPRSKMRPLQSLGTGCDLGNDGVPTPNSQGQVKTWLMMEPVAQQKVDGIQD